MRTFQLLLTHFLLLITFLLLESKPHGCRFCTKKFRTPAHRKSHEATHTKHRFLSDCLSDDKVNTLLDSTVNQAAGNQLITDAVFIDNAVSMVCLPEVWNVITCGLNSEVTSPMLII